MPKSYLLLRNNQQSGPFTEEELKELSLKPNDLAWVIGQSAGWCFPEELALLKTSDQKQAIPPTISSIKKDVASITEQVSSDSIKSEEARHIYVSLPANAVHQVISSPVVITEESTPSFEERVAKLQQRVASVHAGDYAKEEPIIDTKYSRSLNDIKEEYSSWLHTQKKKRSTTIEVKHIGIAAILLITLLGSLWIAQYIFAKPESIVAATQKEAPSPAGSSVLTAPVLETSINTIDQQVKEPQSMQQPINGVKQKEHTQTTTKFNQEWSNKKRTIDQPLKKTASSPAVPQQKTTPSATVNSTSSIADQIDVKADLQAGQKQRGMRSMAITVTNNSGQGMKVIAVDVMYYVEGMKVVDRKTLYFSNVASGETVTLQAPGHSKADGAYAKLGLISSEAGSIYYAANR